MSPVNQRYLHPLSTVKNMFEQELLQKTNTITCLAKETNSFNKCDARVSSISDPRTNTAERDTP